MVAPLWILGPVILSNACSTAAEASRVKSSGRVVHGEDANILDFPFYGALAPKRFMFLDKEKTHLAISCGSSLIAPRFFITAHHCFLKHADPLYWVIILGVKDRCEYDGKGRVLEVSWIYKHPQAKISANAKMNDVALVLVTKPVTGVTPLALPVEPPQVNERGYIIGFGLAKITKPQGDIKDMACRPQRALQYVPEQSTCHKPHETIVGAFCIKDVHDQDAAACRGDSGGPYVVLRNGQRTLLGLSSFGDKLCNPSANSDHFTNVHYYVQWINSILLAPPPESYRRIKEQVQQFEQGARGDEGRGMLRLDQGSSAAHSNPTIQAYPAIAHAPDTATQTPSAVPSSSFSALNQETLLPQTSPQGSNHVYTYRSIIPQVPSNYGSYSVGHIRLPALDAAGS